MKKLLPGLFLLLFIVSQAMGQVAQERTVTGTVTAREDGLPLPGVSVVVKGTKVGTQTNSDGKFTLRVPAGSNQLEFRFIGYAVQTANIGTNNVINTALVLDTEQLGEVVVVGYGTQQKKDVTSSISSISGSTLTELATPSFDRMLAGRATGVQVITPSGLLGQAPQIRIRGVNSITSGTAPLFVIDGIPAFSGNIGGFTEANALGDINPNDIESLEILKDGAATAIYGSRAANGVVLITTKRGKEGQVKFSYDGNYGQGRASNLFDLLNADEFITIANERFTNANQSPQANQTPDGNGGNVNTNWMDFVFRDAAQQNHSVSATAGNDRTKFFVSLGYSDQQGIAQANSLKRYSVRTNLDQKINKVLSFGLNLGLTGQTNLGPLAGSNNLSGNTFGGMRMLPNVAVFDPNHPTGYNIDAADPRALGRGGNLITISDGIPNLRFVLDNNIRKAQSYRMLGSANLSLKIMDGLDFKTQFGIDGTYTDDFSFTDPRHGDGYSANGNMSQAFSPALRWNFQNILNYAKTFNGNHNIGVTAVQELQKQKSSFFQANTSNISDIFFNKNIVSGTFVTPTVNGGLVENGIESYLGRFNYNFKNKYYLSASFRADALSSLPIANRWGYFPGAGFAYRVSEESFFKDATALEFISDFRIRGSFGEVGNTNIGNFPYLGTYGAAAYGTQSGIAFNNTGNPDLKWESQKTYDLGFDLGLLNNRVNFVFAYWMKDTDDLILNAPTPPSLGVPGNSISRNIGRIKNNGLEFSLEGNVIQKSDFTWNSSVNFSTQKNQVMSLVNNQDITGAYNLIREGESINSIYGYIYRGVNPANGNPTYQKADGSLIQGNIPTSSYFVYDPANPATLGAASSLAGADRVLLGSVLPKWFGGFNNNVTFKNFDANVFFRFQGGNVIMNRTSQDLLSQNFVNNGREILGRWQSPTNPGDGRTPKQWSSRGSFINLDNQATSRFVEKGDFLRLDNVALGYTLPGSIVSKVGVSKLRIYGSVQNANVWTKYTGLDPEVNTNGAGVDFNGNPQQRTFMFGLNVGF